MFARKTEHDYLFKILLISPDEGGSGKTCLMQRYSQDKFTSSYISTIGVDFSVKTQSVFGSVCKSQIWDTASQRRFRSITGAYYRGAHGVLLCFDLTKRAGFEELEKEFIEEMQRWCQLDTLHVILVGMKCDLKHERQVTFEEANVKYDVSILVVIMWIYCLC